MTSYSRPSAEQVREALRRIPTPQLRRAFYEGLKNPLWLEPLKDEGAFLSPPAREAMDDGSIVDPYWPEMEYVVRVAREAPTAAVDILIELKDSDNAWVRRALFAVGAAVSASEAARLKPVLKAWMGTGFGWRSDPHEMVSFVVNLISGGERRVGEWVANALFRPGVREDSRKPDLVMEEYWYEAGLPQVVEALGPAGFPMVFGWLVEYRKASGHMDDWGFSRPSIRERQDTHRDVENALIDATRDLAVERMRIEPLDTTSRLLAVKSMLARRIAMFASAEVLAQSGATGEPKANLLAAANQLLFDPLSNDERCRVDFGELARELAKHAPADLDSMIDFIARGPAVGRSALRERLKRDEDESEADVDARVSDFTERWEHSWLSTVGASALPSVLVTRLAELDERLGVIDDPLRPPFMITSWSGPNSPLTQDEMAAMSSEELIAHLETWHDSGDGWGPEPSHEGQARELMSLVSSNPQAIAEVKDLVRRLRPTYLRAILGAWEAALKANFDLDWSQVTDTVRDVLAHGDELDLPREGGDMDDDPDFSGAKQAAVGLLAQSVKKADPPRVPSHDLEELANILIDLAASDDGWAAYAAEDRESGMDPLTLSLNWQWPILIRGLASLLGHGPATPWNARARLALLGELERPDARGASRAVIGESLGRLLNVDEEWTTSHIPDWFGSQRGISRSQQIALSTAMAVHHYHRRLFELLTPPMLAALALAEPIADGWQHHNSTPKQRIGEWVVKGLVHGHAEWSDPVVAAYFSSADAVERGAALGHVAWEFMHAKAVDETIRDRFADVWDSRIAHVSLKADDSAELREFYWVVRSGKFSVGWWLPRLKRALELDPDLAAERYMIGKDLAAAADVDPRAALEVLRLLLGASKEPVLATLDLSRNAVPMVIARALGANDPELHAEATALMNELGEAGSIDLAKQVDAILSGNITQEDIPE